MKQAKRPLSLMNLNKPIRVKMKKKLSKCPGVKHPEMCEGCGDCNK